MYCTDEAVIRSGLARLRRMRLWVARPVLTVVAATAGFQIAGLAFGSVTERLFHNGLFLLVWLLLWATIPVSVLLWIWLKFFAACPRCGSQFHGDISPIPQTACSNCGLREDATNLRQLLTGRSSP